MGMFSSLNGFVGNVKIDGNYLITRISDTQISVVVSGLTTITTRGEVLWPKPR